MIHVCTNLYMLRTSTKITASRLLQKIRAITIPVKRPDTAFWPVLSLPLPFVSPPTSNDF